MALSNDEVSLDARKIVETYRKQRNMLPYLNLKVSDFLFGPQLRACLQALLGDSIYLVR